jgi:hypothetical protein
MGSFILLQWPWLALYLGVLGVLVLSIAFFRTHPKSQYQLLFWLPLPLYMLHQFEGHGIDFFGNYYSFQDTICAIRSKNPSFTLCPISSLFIFSVNIGTVWLAGILSGIFGKQKPILAAGMWGLLFINAILHIFNSMQSLKYTPGSITSIVLFLPFSLFAYYTFLMYEVFRFKDIILSILIGIAMHKILFKSLILLETDVVGDLVLIPIQILNGLIPLFISLLPFKDKNNSDG